MKTYKNSSYQYNSQSNVSSLPEVCLNKGYGQGGDSTHKRNYHASIFFVIKIIDYDRMYCIQHVRLQYYLIRTYGQSDILK